MNYLLVFAIIVVVLLLTTSTEGFTESFGLSGYTKPVSVAKLDDPRPDLSGYREVEVSVSNDRIEEFVLQANKEISKRTGLCTYIIETTSIKGYVKDKKEVYECMFMAMKKDGFSFGFSVVATFEVENDKVRIVSLRSQPLGVQVATDVSAFTNGSSGKEFVNYELIKEVAVPKESELQMAKNKLR